VDHKVPGDVTQCLLAWGAGDPAALDALLPLVYRELRGLAARYLRRERREHTLETAALVHEAYVRLVDQRRVEWHNRAQFFALASRMMRRVLVDHARRRRFAKRGGGQQRLTLDDATLFARQRPLDFLALDEALDRLEARDPQQCRLIEMRFFGGLTFDEIAQLQGVSTPTVARRWRLARAWLYARLQAGQEAHDA
jgi:RNA polymerase sigma factor (TIGR02999 family)